VRIAEEEINGIDAGAFSAPSDVKDRVFSFAEKLYGERFFRTNPLFRHKKISFKRDCHIATTHNYGGYSGSDFWHNYWNNRNPISQRNDETRSRSRF